ncbi:hypothetical protein EON79_04885 [bacterium]|nr:MAG: hypothetical protein EON79_04885 [bacterium]
MGIRMHRGLVPALFTSALGLLIGCAGGGDSVSDAGTQTIPAGSYSNTVMLSDGRSAGVVLNFAQNGTASGSVTVAGSPMDGNGPAIQNAIYTFSGTADRNRGTFRVTSLLGSGETIVLSGTFNSTNGNFTVSSGGYSFSGTLTRIPLEGGTGSGSTNTNGATGGSTGLNSGSDGTTATTTNATTDAGTTAGTTGSNTDAGTDAGTDGSTTSAGTDGSNTDGSGTEGSQTDGSGTDGTTDAGTTDAGTSGSNTDASTNGSTDGSTVGTTTVGTSGGNG